MSATVIKAGRLSQGGRRSSTLGRGTQVEVRPISDKGFQRDCIRKLCNYLTTSGYSNAVSPKMLQAPPSKDVTSIIQFIFTQADPSFKFMKVEEDVPLFFKYIGYPIAISRSALYAAGSPISWPSLLAALTWLIDLITLTEVSADGTGRSAFDALSNQMFNDYVEENYKDFLLGKDDDVERRDKEFCGHVEKEKENDVAECERLNADLGSRKEVLQKLKGEKSPLEELKNKKSDFQNDIVKFNQYIATFTTHKQEVENKNNLKSRELNALKEEVLSRVKAVEDLKETVKAQQVNAAVVEKMSRQKELLDANLQAALARREELQKAAWNLEVQSASKLRELDFKASDYNDASGRLKTSLGEELEIEVQLQPRGETPYEILGGNLKTSIKPRLKEIMEANKKKATEELDPEKSRLEEELFNKEIECQKKNEAIDSAATGLKKLEAQYKTRFDKLNASVSSIVEEREELERRTAAEEDKFENLQSEIVQGERATQIQLKMTVDACDKQVDYEKGELTAMLENVLFMREQSSEILGRVHSVADRAAQVFMEATGLY